MTKCRLCILISAVLLWPTFCIAANTTDDTNSGGPIIASLKTAGNTTISSTIILAKVRSKAGQTFEPAVADEDARRIAELDGVVYCYYNTEIELGKLTLTFVVVEKNIVRSIQFHGNRQISDKKLRKQLGFKAGDYLDPILAETDRIKITEFYQKKGFCFSQVALDGEKLSQADAVYTITEGPRVRIKSVEFTGNRILKTSELKKTIKTASRKFLVLPKYYTEQQLAEDVLKLQNVYQKKSFLDVRINAIKEFNKNRDKVRISFQIEEGPLYTVEKINITGNEYFNSERLYAELKLQPDQPYSEALAQADAKRLLKLYHEIGFIEADVRASRNFTQPARVAVEFDISEGQRFRIGLVNITGNQDTQDKVVRHVLDEYDFKPGEWYNADIARGDRSGYLEKLIRNATLAQSATITPKGQTPGQRDAIVDIVEGQTGMVMVGAGVASDSGAIGQFIFEQRNFDIKDTPESFGDFITGKAFKGAGQTLRVALEPGTVVSTYSVSFTEPYFRDKPISLDVVGSSYERARESYDEQRTKGYLAFEKRYKDRWRRSIRFRAEDVGVDSLDFDAPEEIRDVEGSNALFGTRLAAGKDITDDIFNPTTGHKFELAYEQLAGENTFGILSGIYRQYKTVREDLAERKTILATKLEAATAVGDAPPFEKFYAGGQGSLRGFDYRGVSTRGLQTNVANPERKDPIGSDWIFLANAELIVPLVSDNLAGLFFVDSGTIDTGPYRLAVGTGIQILLPQWFGPVPMRFELAVPVMKGEDDDTQVFSFSIGRLF